MRKGFDQRRIALEEEFFAKHNAKLLEKLRREASLRKEKEALSQTSGITDEEVLEGLIASNISSETLAALSLIPLIEVAWSDGHLDDRERKAILAAAEADGIAAESDAHQLLENWLRNRPGERMLSVWSQYVSALCQKLGAEARRSLCQELMGRAGHVAKAAGGFAGLVGMVSRNEKAMLARLEKAFE